MLAQLTFAVLTGNGDAHAKNVRILAQPDGEWWVSPPYDLPSSQPYGDLTLAMPVNDRRTDVGARDLLALAASIGLPEAAVKRALQSAITGECVKVVQGVICVTHQWGPTYGPYRRRPEFRPATSDAR